MGRPRKEAGSRRYFVTVTVEEGERIEAYAASVDRRPTTAARDLLLAGLTVATDHPAGDLAAAERRIEELERQLEAVFRAHPPPAPVGKPPGPRWEWPVADLLADAVWWDRWLPRLNELMGRDLRPVAGEAVLDDRGYVDLMTYLFPDLQRLGRTVSWRSPGYPSSAAHGAHEGMLAPTRPCVWEPVLRHVAVALSALEQSAQPGADPQLRLDTAERLTGAWVRTLRNLIGDGQVESLPRPPR